MVIVETRTLSKIGNDCLISKDVALAILNDEFVVIESTRYSGWQGNETNTQIHQNELSRSDANKLYNRIIKEF